RAGSGHRGRDGDDRGRHVRDRGRRSVHVCGGTDGERHHSALRPHRGRYYGDDFGERFHRRHGGLVRQSAGQRLHGQLGHVAHSDSAGARGGHGGRDRHDRGRHVGDHRGGPVHLRGGADGERHHSTRRPHRRGHGGDDFGE